MKRGIRYTLGGLAIAAIVGVTYVLNFGLYPRFFDIAWDEEVQLHDGRVIVVHVKRTFERLNSFERWRGIYRDTEITFDAGPPWGRFSRKFQRYEVNMVEQLNGNWYLSLGVTTGTPPTRVVSAAYPILILDRNGVERPARSWDDLPDFPRHNIMPLTPSPEAVLPFANSLLTSQAKIEHWKKYPRAAGDDGLIIQRHTNKLGGTK